MDKVFNDSYSDYYEILASFAVKMFSSHYQNFQIKKCSYSFGSISVYD